MDDAHALDSAHVGVFHHLSYSTSSTAGFRTNIGFANASSFSVGVSISLYGDTGQLLGTPVTRTLKPYEHMQYTRIHERYGVAVTSGFARVEVTTAGGKVHPYAMLIDNASGDPIYMPMELVSRSASAANELAMYLGSGDTVPLVTERIPAGTFAMGSPTARRSRRPLATAPPFDTGSDSVRWAHPAATG